MKVVRAACMLHLADHDAEYSDEQWQRWAEAEVATEAVEEAAVEPLFAPEASLCLVVLGSDEEAEETDGDDNTDMVGLSVHSCQLVWHVESPGQCHGLHA